MKCVLVFKGYPERNTQGRASHEVLHVFDILFETSCSSIPPTANAEQEGINQEWNRTEVA